MIFLVLPDIPTEDVLLARAKRGEQQAIMEIYDTYSPPIYQYIRMRVNDPMMAEDITSQVFLSFVEAVQKRKAPRKTLRGWLFQVARNLIAQQYRGNLSETTLDEFMSSGANVEGQTFMNISLERVTHAMRMLKAEQQEVIVLRFGQSLNLEETADIMGKSVSAIKSLQFRAIATLRDILGEAVYE